MNKIKTRYHRRGDTGFMKKIRQRPTLPLSRPSSTIGAKELNFRVRDGNGCDLFAIATEKIIQRCAWQVACDVPLGKGASTRNPQRDIQLTYESGYVLKHIVQIILWPSLTTN